MDISSIKTSIEPEIASVDSPQALEQLRVKYLGRKGIIAQLTGSIPSLPPDQRASLGKEINELKNKLNALLEEKQRSFAAAEKTPLSPDIDLSLPGIAQELGRLHPLTQTIEEICAIFSGMGFMVVDGPEIESEYNNFTGLNIPLEHPSREAFDTFYLQGAAADKEKLLLRSQTSTVQIRVMQDKKPPLAVVAPGRVYRPDAVDASHSFMFHQIEGFVVDRGIRFSDLKGTLEFFAKQGLFGLRQEGMAGDPRLRNDPSQCLPERRL